MEYTKKLKKRLYVAIAFIIIGALTAGYAIMAQVENEFFTSYGIALIVCGIIRIRRHVRMTKNEDAVKMQEIAEKDERNLAIAEKAKSWAFGSYIIIVGVAVILLEIMGCEDIAIAAAMSVCGLMVLYWLCHMAVSRKM
ncbi:MAG: hypothetical protein IKU13_09745 [Clostridia bacterium]|nr:hypothetical protein [Clostridia bacterium]